MLITHETRRAGLKHKVVAVLHGNVEVDVPFMPTFWMRNAARASAAALNSAYLRGERDGDRRNALLIDSLREELKRTEQAKPTEPETLIPARHALDFLAPKKHFDIERSRPAPRAGMMPEAGPRPVAGMMRQTEPRPSAARHDDDDAPIRSSMLAAAVLSTPPSPSGECVDNHWSSRSSDYGSSSTSCGDGGSSCSSSDSGSSGGCD